MKRTLTVFAISFLSLGTPLVAAPTHAALWVPPVLTGTTFDLTLAPNTKQILPGAATTTYSYNGNDFWGPTVIVNQGDEVAFNVTNKLAETTTTHWHGIHLPAVMDGGPMQPIEPGETWSPHFLVTNNAATYWYHPHLHQFTQKQLAMGAGGFLIVRDPIEAKLALPRTYGIDDFPVMLTSRSFDSKNQIQTQKVYGDNLLANGVLNAEVAVGAQIVRFRFLNAETERAYNLGFDDQRTFWVVGTDGGLVDSPVGVTRLRILPGERYEVLFDLTKESIGASVSLKSFNSGQGRGFPGAEPSKTGEEGSILNNIDFEVLNLKIKATTEAAVLKVPVTLVKNVFPQLSEVTTSRTLLISDRGGRGPGRTYTFDGSSYDMMRIDQVVKLGSVEAWTIRNSFESGHAFHIHDVQFEIESRSTGPVEAFETGWKDTFYIAPNERVTFVARFADYADAVNPYMYHCHMTNHEDGGLMGQFVVK